MFQSNAQLSEAARELVADRLERGVTIHFRIMTGSMSPTLLPGDRISVLRKPITEITLGSLIMVFHGESWLVHRLVKRSPGGSSQEVWTKGDDVHWCDPAWKDLPLVGMVQGVQRGNRKIELTSRRSQWFGRRIAAVSRLENSIHHNTSGFVRRGLLRGVRLLINQLARCAYG